MCSSTQLKGSATTGSSGDSGKSGADSATTGSSGDSGKSRGEGQHTNVTKKDKSPVMDKDGMCHKLHQTLGV